MTRIYKNVLALLGIFIVLFSGTMYYQATDEFDAKVCSINVQQKINGRESGVNTTYSYIIGTNRGIYTISPDGIFASKHFGTLEKDSTYHFFTRGISIPLIGIYPHIITAHSKKGE